MVQNLCTVESGWSSYRRTYIQVPREANQLSKGYSNLLVIDARAFLAIDSHLRRGILKFLPQSFAARMRFVSPDFAADTVRKFADSQEGGEEQVEFLLQLLGDGDLKITVATKFDKLRSEAVIDQSERPGIHKLISNIFFGKEARTCPFVAFVAYVKF